MEGLARSLNEPPTLDRRRVLKATAATAALAVAGCAPTVSPAQKAMAASLLDDAVSIDLHSHPGMVPSLARATMDGHIERPAKGRVRASLFAAVADAPLLTVNPRAGLY